MKRGGKGLFQRLMRPERIEMIRQAAEGVAQRIRARAIRRAGELLKQIEPQQGGDRRSDQRDATGPLMTRSSAAREAGMSKHLQIGI